MSNQARLSRHASGILPSRQFFAPRKPIPHSGTSLRRKSTYTITPNSRISLQPPSSQPVLSSTNVLFSTSPSPHTFNADQVEIPLTEIPPHINANENASIDNILTTAQTSPEFTKEYLQRCQEQVKKKLGSIESIPQSVIDSVLEPSDILEPRYSRSSCGLPKSFPKRNKKHEQEVKISPYAHLINLFPSVVYMPDKAPKEPSKGRKRAYQVWPGRNKFFLNGRIMTSRDFPAFCVAFLALVVPSLLFLGFTGPFLYTHVSPVVVFIFVYLFLLALTSMLKTSWSDPGIIPRNLDPNPPTEDLEDQEHHVINNSQHPYYPPRSVPLPKDVKINGVALILKYCETCRIYRPPRCSHCRQCDNCVEGEDHHCIWLNNCIGRRNYRTFFTLIATATMMCFYILFFCFIHLYLIADTQKKSFVDALMEVPISFCLAVLAFFLMWSVGGLTCYHTYLILNNMTTHEQLRAPMDKRNGRRNPYDFRRVSLNCCWMLCRPLIHSTMHRRAFVDSRDWGENGSRMSIEPQKPLRHQRIQMTTTTTTTTITTEEGNNSGDTLATRVCVNVSDDNEILVENGICVGEEKGDFDQGRDVFNQGDGFDQEDFNQEVDYNNESKADVAASANASGYSEVSVAHSYTSVDSSASTTPLTPTSIIRPSSREQQEELDNAVA